MMRLFYRFLLVWSSIDLMIARSTGRNPADIAQLTHDCQKWELALWQQEWRLK
jgi:hypothetical protein